MCYYCEDYQTEDSTATTTTKYYPVKDHAYLIRHESMLLSPRVQWIVRYTNSTDYDLPVICPQCGRCLEIE